MLRENFICRTLALSALMTFLITGSAWGQNRQLIFANTSANLEPLGDFVYRIGKPGEKIEITDSESDCYAAYIYDVTALVEGKEISLKQNYEKDSPRTVYAAVEMFNGGVLKIGQEDNIPEKLSLSSTSGYGLYMENASKAYLAAKKIDISGKEAAIMLLGNSELDIDADELVIKGGIISDSTNNAINISAGNFAADTIALNGGTLDMTSARNVGKKITISDALTGGGTLKMNLDWNSNRGAKQETANSDYLYLNGKNNSGTYNLDFDAEAAHLDNMNAIKNVNEDPEDKLYFAYVANGNDGVTFKAAVSEKNAAYIYYKTYEYDLNKDANDDGSADWYVYTKDKNLSDSQISENIPLAKQSLQANYALATEMDSLHKRLGEARYIEPGENSGVWVRYRRARTAWENSFKNNSNTFQVGLDKEYKEKDGKHLRGVSLEYMDASTSLSGLASHGDNKRYALGIYDTWQGEKGHYYDLVLRGGRLNSEYDVITSGNQKINTDYHQWFAALSGEYGRKLELKNSWYVEPQAQLQVARIFSADYATNYGVHMEQDAATSLIGRAGFRVGKDLQTAGGKQRGSVYFKADLLHEFCGDLDYKLSDTRDTASGNYDASSTWWDVGVGASLELSKISAVYLDVERTLGGDFDRTWQINAGFNYSF